MKAICGANCLECKLLESNKCKGCKETNGCPFGKKCWIAKYIEVGGKTNFTKLKEEIIKEVNTLNIEEIPKIKELYPLNGSFINKEYFLPNGLKTRFLNDNDIYLGNQVECIFNDNEIKKYYGVVANMNFILICEYEENETNPEIVLYKRR